MSDTKRPIVFIVDDDAMFLEMMKDHLLANDPKKYELWGFITGEQCLDHLYLDPAVVILDYYLDSMDKLAENGLEILKKIKAAKPETPVIMLSSQEKYGLAAQTLLEGAVYYIIKDDSAFAEAESLIEDIVNV